VTTAAGSGAALLRTVLCWGTVQGAGLVELIDVAADAGFDGITSTPALYFEALADGFTETQLQQRLADRGIAVSVIDPLLAALPGCPAPSSVPERFRSTFEYDEDQCFEAALALGATLVNAAHYLGAPTPLTELADALRGVCHRAATHNIAVAVEFMPEGSIGDLATAVELIGLVGAANVSIMLDTWHFYRTGGGLDELTGLRPGTIGGLQVSDAGAELRGVGTAARVRDRRLPGEGAIGLVPLLRVVMQGQGPLDVGVEVFSGRAPAGPTAHAAAVALRSLLVQLDL
jgi:sugar phosphate isomerase/epimerase